MIRLKKGLWVKFHNEPHLVTYSSEGMADITSMSGEVVKGISSGSELPIYTKEASAEFEIRMEEKAEGKKRGRPAKKKDFNDEALKKLSAASKTGKRRGRPKGSKNKTKNKTKE